MNCLLDTHTLIWAITNKKALSTSARHTIENMDNIIMVSAVSLWEISLKFSLKKLDINGFLPEQLPELATNSGFNLISLSPLEATAYHQLPIIDNHKDPFDRMLIMQAIHQDLTLITKDKSIAQYRSVGLKLLW